MLDVFYKVKIASGLEGGNVDKAKNVDFRVYDQGIGTHVSPKQTCITCLLR